jgi:hypothetical protein
MADAVAPTQIFTARMVRELKGAPLSVLILLLSADQPVSNQWLETMSGYSDKPIAQALHLLSSPEYQIVVRTYKGWRISNGFNFALISRRNSVPTTTTILINKDNDNEVVAVDTENLRFMRNLEACKECGIGEPSASQISDLEHITPEFIHAHKQALSRGETIGLAIVRIKNNEPIRKNSETIEPVTYSMEATDNDDQPESERIPDHIRELWGQLDDVIEPKGKVRAQYSATRLISYVDNTLHVKTIGDLQSLQMIFSQVSNQIQLAEV